MKKALVIALFVMGSIALHAQDVVRFEFSGGIENSYIKTKMERQVSNLLTAINRAETYGTDVNYSGIDIDNLASQSIGMMWNNVHMRILDNDIREVCLRVNTSGGSLMGYQVRNIAVTMIPTSADYDEDINQEICVDFDKTGKITDFNLTLGVNQWNKIRAESEELNDFDKRVQILKWTEYFRNAYCQKNISFIDDLLSEDALIITGKKCEHVPYEGSRPKVEYRVYDKQRYLKNLRVVFQNNRYVNVQFDDIVVDIHRRNPNIYGVKLVQRWNSSTYNDVGWLFIIWDFTDEFKPKILVRTWVDFDDYTVEEYLNDIPDLDKY